MPLEIVTATPAVSAVFQPDPLTAFFMEYINYILFGVGLFILIWALSTYIKNKYKKDELAIIDMGEPSEDDTPEN